LLLYIFLQESMDEFKVDPHSDSACGGGDEVDHHHSPMLALPVVKSEPQVC
jgi:hypothetical protein